MNDKKHELYLVCMALAVAAILILYNTFTAPSVKIASLPQTSAVTLQVQASDFKSGGSQSGTANKNIPPAIVNINTASIAELTTLPGIGEVKAAAIVEYRTENGRFIAKEELLNVTGIGQKIFADIAPYITL
ncbi:MAG: helix-hairpin-helix domain-containing protein [Oscillospiraceae bacterium]|nr:helix-hairpin-helix domain-containing protein [Oscillospiraceae bacterium]